MSSLKFYATYLCVADACFIIWKDCWGSFEPKLNTVCVVDAMCGKICLDIFYIYFPFWHIYFDWNIYLIYLFLVCHQRSAANSSIPVWSEECCIVSGSIVHLAVCLLYCIAAAEADQLAEVEDRKWSLVKVFSSLCANGSANAPRLKILISKQGSTSST